MTTSDLQGQIERITYTNDENGYTVAKVKAYGHHDLITVVGNFMSPMPGEVLDMKGEWHNHPKFGQQFKVLSYNTKVPATVYGIRKYLGSGLIKGLGPIIAERIVSKFGENTLDVIEEKIESLNQVEGIGKKRIAMIQKAWEDQKEIREVMLFLQTHGVSSGYAAKIFKQYGKEAITIVQENPYRLATDIFGIGFITADRIAQKIGFAKDSPMRASAGVLYVLNQLADEGHVYYPYDPLMDKAAEILELGREIAADAIAQLAADRKLVIEDLNDAVEEFKPNHKAVFLTQFHVCESGIAHRLKLLLHIPKAMPLADPDATIQEIQSHKAIQLAEKQIQAVKCAIQSKVMVITGGPGTGKTTIIDTVINVFKAFGYKMLLAAPTGRAAKRMNEATGHPAKTIHRLLEYSMAKGGFQKNYENPLDCDALIIDEASMIDTVLMYHLLKAVPNRATLILVGDVNQLPSVGAGNVLNDIIESGAVPVVSLTEIFRQAKQSKIIINAHKINQGFMPYSDNKDCDDFYFIEKESPEDVLNIILRLAKDRIPARFGFHPIDDIQVLTPMNKGIVGAVNLNIELQKALNPENNTEFTRGQRSFRLNDKVMQIRNNYDKEVFNGDIGRITNIDVESQELVIIFDGREVVYEFSECDEIVLAYSVSVHKAQGSEYPAVIIPVLIQHYMLLQRNLIYTAVTRGKKLVVLVGTKKALAIAIRNDKTQKRFTRLRERLG